MNNGYFAILALKLYHLRSDKLYINADIKTVIPNNTHFITPFSLLATVSKTGSRRPEFTVEDKVRPNPFLIDPGKIPAIINSIPKPPN